MSYVRARQTALRVTTTFLVGSSLCLAALAAQACDDAKEDAMNSSSTYQHVDQDASEQGTNMEVASQATKANASASASASASSSASSSSDGKGDCTAESSASAEASAGDKHERDYDSASEKSESGDCRASSESKARATSGDQPSDSTGADMD